MAVMTSDFYPVIAEIESLIDIKIPEIESQITTMTSYLDINTSDGSVFIDPANRSNFNSNLTGLNLKLKNLMYILGFSKCMELLSAISIDNSDDAKVNYVTDVVRML